MKKLLAVISAALIVLSFAACNKAENNDTTESAATSAQASVATADIMNEIRNGGYLPESNMELTTNDMLDYYGIEASEIKQCSVVLNSSGWQDELIIIEAVDSAAADSIKTLLNNHIQNQCDSMRDYDAKMYDIVSKCSVVTNGNYIALFISADYEALNGIFNSYFA